MRIDVNSKSDPNTTEEGRTEPSPMQLLTSDPNSEWRMTRLVDMIGICTVIQQLDGTRPSERPKAKVSIKPNQHVFRGETVTLRCDIDAEGVTSWRYYWYKGGSTRVISELQEHKFSSVSEFDAGKYSCNGSETEGSEKGGSRSSQLSDEVTLTVSGSSNHYELLSDSSRGSGGKYTVSSAALNHTGVYVCRAEREKTAHNTKYSNTQPLWVTGVSPRVSLIISPSRTQHFTSVSLSLSCEDQSNSDGWTVRRYTERRGLEDCSSSAFGSQTRSTCKISSTHPSDTGVYWCQSVSGESYHHINITVHICRVPVSTLVPRVCGSISALQYSGVALGLPGSPPPMALPQLVVPLVLPGPLQQGSTMAHTSIGFTVDLHNGSALRHSLAPSSIISFLATYSINSSLAPDSINSSMASSSIVSSLAAPFLHCPVD
ncbi:hypothetical protein DPX16_12048 [Anabarilius grahami]|uniref:Ig-like domain-containing protein n=1 Tax=Anabarilius grahami TaxID=495550 RepID=A0A3N0YXV7_ANAGA|nr:hypothetical protein DPX16_12048 [Anabarilius grahami]